MSTPLVAPYGSWKSPITTDLMVSETVGLNMPLADGQDIYWIESLPLDGGRCVIVRRTPDGQQTTMTPSPFYVRTTVHEYGGGDYTVSNGVLFFSNFKDQRLYRQDPEAEPRAITPEVPYRYADATVDRRREHVICVREDHSVAGREAVNTLVSLSPEDNPDGGKIIAGGNDFYATPRISPDGAKLAWLTWHHPNMPWDGTELWVGDLNDDGSLSNMQQVVGGPNESIFQPEWSPDGALYFISDRSGWWNFYRWRNGQVERVYQRDLDFGMPQWGFGMSTYAFVAQERIICWYAEQGLGHLASLNTASGEFQPIQQPYTTIDSVRAAAGGVVFRGVTSTGPVAIVRLDLSSGTTQALRVSRKLDLDLSYISEPQNIEFPTEHGQTAYAFYYPPRNPDYVAPPGELPPLLVFSHGGPTGATNTMLNLSLQYFTSRGIAAVDVNYGGSTGYGRAYRQRLNGQWGVVDVDDCINAAKYLVARGLADGNRLAIRGGSAGGYTTLCALTFRDVFKVGASYYGVSEIETLAQETHKFESRYDHSMIGPYPERRDLYYERSPLHFTDRLSCPIIFFQGLDDKVVVPSQSEMMVEALRKKGIPVAYLAFEGEGHGFRKAENMKRSLEAELYFYARVLGFAVADEVEPVEIENM